MAWWAQFRLEARFGFNRSTLRLWIVDQLKFAVLGFAVGFPLLWLVLKLVDWIGPAWWWYAWAATLLYQLILLVIAPKVFLPWFNKLTPLAEGELRSRLLALADRAGFRASTIQVMDGSKRSSHSNALFTGFGRFRRIVLYDTLIAQLGPEELEAVLAHEIGHYKLGHIPRLLVVSAVTSLATFWLAGWIVRTPEVFAAFGFAEATVAIGVVLLMLAGGAFSFWFGPLGNIVSRRFEYQADAFARAVMGGAPAMVAALHKLSRENLANLTPHPWYSAFYYSHPTLGERVAALRRARS
jgi:STE24 endopeptidase